jgi:hypothetical protein
MSLAGFRMLCDILIRPEVNLTEIESFIIYIPSDLALTVGNYCMVITVGF